MAIPGTPFYALFAFLDVYRVAHALSHVIQFLNFFRCCHSAHLLQLYNEKSAEMRDRQMRIMGKAQRTRKNHRLRRLTGLHNRGEHWLILYRFELKNLIIRDTSFMKRILLDEFVDLAPSFYAGDDDSTGSRNLGAGDQELAELIRLIEKIAMRLSNTFHFLDGNLVIQENEKMGKRIARD